MPAAFTLDALGTLLPLTWRGLEVPCQHNEVDVKQRTVEHRQYGVQASHVENTGRDSARFSFKCLFRAGIKGYTTLYPQRFRDFFNACLDGSAGKLVHPEFGELDARVDTFKTSYDPNRRDGVDLDVVWIETNEDDFVLEQSYLMADAINNASFLDNASPAADIPPYDDGSGMSLSETLKSIQGALLLAQLDVAACMAQISNAINAVNDMIDFASGLTNPAASPIVQAAKMVEAALERLLQTLPGTRSVRTVSQRIAPKNDTVSGAAASYGMSMEDWFSLNPRTAASGTVARGDIVFVYES